MESRFIIENGENIAGMLNLLDECSPKLQVTILIPYFFSFFLFRQRFGVSLWESSAKVSAILKHAPELV